MRTKHIRDRAVTWKKLPHGGALYGRRSANAELAPLLSWRPMRLRVRTGTDVDSSFEVRITNANPPGGPSFRVVQDGGVSTPIQPGNSAAFGSLTGLDALVVENQGSGRMVQLRCFANVISLGDDGFMQCTAITAGRSSS